MAIAPERETKMVSKFLGRDGKYHTTGSFLGQDGKYHPKGFFLGAFLGNDGKYHPQGSFLGVHGMYEEPESAAQDERRNQNGVDC